MCQSRGKREHDFGPASAQLDLQRLSRPKPLFFLKRPWAQGSCHWLSSNNLAQPPFRNQILPHHLAAQEMLLQDALQHRRIAVAVPGAVGVDDGDWTSQADVEAV